MKKIGHLKNDSPNAQILLFVFPTVDLLFGLCPSIR